MHSEESGPKEPEKKKSRRPANTAFRQQRLKAWQPILTPKTVLPLFFIIGIIFAPIGGLLFWANSKVQELRLDYTDCIVDAPEYSSQDDNFASMPSSKVHSAFRSSNQSINARWAVAKNVSISLDYSDPDADLRADRCYLRFNIPEDMGHPVYFYYYMTNFYQNHRRYVESFNAEQLNGQARSYSQIQGSKCDPLDVPDDGNIRKPYYPCGLIANSLFNDTFSLPRKISGEGENRNYSMTKSGVAWASDADLYEPSGYDNPEDIIPPPNWRERYPNGYSNSVPPPNLKEWEAFQVWMRTAGLPTFSKLYQKNENETLTAGTYEVIVDYSFPTRAYKGTKSILISTRTIMGGRNSFLGIAYMAVGGICIILGAVFTVTHLIKPRKLGDHTYLSWNNAPASGKQQQPGSSAAIASGRDLGRAEA